MQLEMHHPAQAAVDSIPAYCNAADFVIATRPTRYESYSRFRVFGGREVGKIRIDKLGCLVRIFKFGVSLTAGGLLQWKPQGQATLSGSSGGLTL